MTQPDTLHDRLRAEINRRLAVARAAQARMGHGEWRYATALDNHRTWHCVRAGNDRLVCDSALSEDVAEHIALHDPADAVRRYEGELDLLSRYDELATESVARLTQDELIERAAELRLLRELIDDLAHRLGVNVDGQTTT